MFSISIIIPIFKVEQYVEKCIKSIIEQENEDMTIECIIVDDYSPDKSMSIVHSIVDDYNGNISFTLVRHEENKGLSAARNTGIDLAHGDFIMFVDSDDWLPLNSISKLVKVLKENPDIDMVAGNYYRVKEKSAQPITIIEPTLFDNYQLRKGLLNYQNVSCTAWNKLIRASIVKINKFPRGVIFEDNIWTYFLFNHISQAIIIPDETYVYENDHPFSITNTSKSERNATMHVHSIVLFGNALLNNPYDDLFVDSIFFLLSFLITALRLRIKYNLVNEDGYQLLHLRKRCVLFSFKNGNWFLAFYIFCLTYPPTSYIFNIGWFRRHYHIIGKIGYRIASSL